MNTNSTSKGKNNLAGADSIFQKIVITALDILLAVYTTVIPKITDLFQPQHGLVIADMHPQPGFSKHGILSFTSGKRSINNHAVSPVAMLHNDNSQHSSLQNIIKQGSA